MHTEQMNTNNKGKLKRPNGKNMKIREKYMWFKSLSTVNYFILSNIYSRNNTDKRKGKIS